VPLSEEDKRALSKTGSILEEAYRLCRERGIRFIVVFVPAEYRVYYGLPNMVEVSDFVKGWIVNDLPERLGAIVAGISTDVEYLDLTPTFRAATAEGTSVFLADDTHWTAEGHRIVAEALHRLEADTSTYVVTQGAGQFEKGVALMVRAPDGTIRYWNKGAEHLYGWQPQEALGKSSHQVLKTIFPKPLKNIETELMKTGRWEGELVHERRDGSHVIVSSRWELQRDVKDGSPTVIEINHEHVAKKRGDQMDQDLALLVRAPNGTIRYWNKGAEHLYGWGPQEALGKSSHRVLKTVFPQPLPSIEAELIKTGHWEGQLVHKRRDGSQVIVSSRWELQRNEDLPPTVVEINSEPLQKS
jgi:PAS domain S-box-containing protein